MIDKVRLVGLGIREFIAMYTYIVNQLPTGLLMLKLFDFQI